MNQPLISIILPAYNAERTIGKTIASVLAQTHANFELLVINDGSSDQTARIVASIADPRITMFSYANAGQAASRNRGLKQVNGDYVAFIDADDLWTPDKLAAQLIALQGNPQAALAYSWVDYIDPQDHLLHPGCHVAVSGDVYGRLLLANFLECGSNPLICRSALTAVGEFDASLSNADDWDMWLRLAKRYPFVCVKAPQILYRVSPASVSANIQGLEQSTHLILERNFSQASAELQALKPVSLSNLYLYFLFRTLETAQSRRNSLQAVRYLGLALKYNPSLPQQRTRLTLIALTKLALSLVLSPQVARTQLRRAKPTF
jgi:glycosyltransferase involved in cell wall biosynthesis